MPTSRERDWRRGAACRGEDTDRFFPDKKTLLVPEEIRPICERCPVRAPCLAEALVFHEDGVWGGTTERQRALLRRRYRRDSCPSCGPSLLVWYGNRQVCTGCGLSWIVVRARNRAGLIQVRRVEP